MRTPIYSLDEALDQLKAEAIRINDKQYSLPKHASLRTVASLLRELPEQTISYSDLHQVKTALQTGSIKTASLPEPRSYNGPGRFLKQAADALRSLEVESQKTTMIKAAHILCAAKGLALLNQKI